MALRVLRVVLLLLATLSPMAAACSVTPVPEPPNLAPPDLARITFGTSSGTGVLNLHGDPGALPSGARLWVVDLDGTAAPAETVAGGDGSFDLVVGARFGDELRLQTRTDAGRSEPVDVRAPAATPVVRPLAGCLRASPAAEVVLDAAAGAPAFASVLLESTCEEAVSLDAARLRVPNDAFRVETPLPLELTAGGPVELALRFAPPATGDAEEILFLELTTASAEERRPLTLVGRTAP